MDKQKKVSAPLPGRRISTRSLSRRRDNLDSGPDQNSNTEERPPGPETGGGTGDGDAREPLDTGLPVALTDIPNRTGIASDLSDLNIEERTNERVEILETNNCQNDRIDAISIRDPPATNPSVNRDTQDSPTLDPRGELSHIRGEAASLPLRDPEHSARATPELNATETANPPGPPASNVESTASTLAGHRDETNSTGSSTSYQSHSRQHPANTGSAGNTVQITPPYAHSPSNSVQEFVSLIAQQQHQINRLLQMLPSTSTSSPSISGTSSTVVPTFALPPFDQLLPQFSGKDEDNPIDFIRKFTDALRSYHLPEHAWRATLRSQLTGTARQWYERNSARFQNLQTFIDLFKQHFDSSIVRTKLKANFYGTHQSTPENSEAFVNAKIKLYTRLFPDGDEPQMIADILQLLHPKIQVHLMNAPPTIDDLVQRLDVIERSFSTTDKHRAPTKPESRNNQNNNSANPRTQTARPVDNSIPYPTPFLPSCRYCPGRHYHKDCPVARQTYGRQNPPTSGPFRPPHPQQPTGPPNARFQNSNAPPPRRPENPPRENPGPSQHNTNIKAADPVSPSVNINVEGRAYPVMIDTGASECFIRKDYIPGHSYVKVVPRAYAAVANADHTPIDGSVEITFTLGKSTYTETFLVLEQMSVPIILGASWMYANGVVLDMSRKVMTLGKPERENVPFFNKTISQLHQTPDIDFGTVQHDVPEEHFEEFRNLIVEFADVFDTSVLQQTTAIQHQISLTTQRPVHTASYRLSPRKNEFIQKQVKDMLGQHLIEPSDSPYNSPIVVIEYPNSEKEPRFCVDYRKLNGITVDQNCPGINIHELVRNIGEHKIFCTIDLKKGYWQVPLAPHCKPYTAFSTPDGNHYQFTVMPFGLKGAPGTFIRLMGKVLEGLIGNIVEVYLDDLIVKAQTWPSLLHNLRIILERLRQFQLTAHLQKCHFGKSEVQYLGHLITSEHNLAPTAHIQAIQKAPTPKSKRQLQSFLGTCNWLREYVPRASEVMAPLYQITSRKPFKWTHNDDLAFQRVKDAFSKLEPLHRPTPDLPYVLQTDASGIGLGASLFQVQEGKNKIIANISASLSDTEKRYSSNEKECLAVLWAITKLRPYLEGRPFVLRTDNRALMWLHKFKEERSKLMRWALTLQEYQFQVEHVAGSKNLLPDALSRNPSDEIANDSVEPNLFPPLPADQDIPSLKQTQICALQTEPNPSLVQVVKQAQKEDETCNERIFNYQFLLQSPPSTHQEEDREFLKHYQVINSHLYYRHKDHEDWRLYAPQSAVKEILRAYHDHELYCHPGTNATGILIRPNFYWPNMYRDISAYIQACDVCARTKVTGRSKNLPYTARIADKKFHTWSLDLMGPYVPSTRGNRYLIVFSDLCSKWVEAKPIRNATTGTIIRFLEEEVFSRYGYPEKILTDNGAQFRSEQWKQTCERWGTTHLTTASYSPRQNQVERRNQSIKDKLRIQLLQKPHKHWDLRIHQILYSLRNTVNRATRLTPAEVCFNQKLRHPRDEKDSEQDYTNYSVAGTPPDRNRDNLAIAIANQRSYVDKYQGHIPASSLWANGDILYIRNHELSNAPKGVVAALNPKWIGPFRVVETHATGVYVCQSLDNPKDFRKVAHQDTQRRHWSTIGNQPTDSSPIEIDLTIEANHLTPRPEPGTEEYESQPERISNRNRSANPRYFSEEWVNAMISTPGTPPTLYNREAQPQY
ncbi:hypothetical protein M8J77_016641 [Diaphorina citri]|nr:hypothetical protein M8J77_016641 [Diaphorina citri]